jgi:hypothetical protein
MRSLLLAAAGAAFGLAGAAVAQSPDGEPVYGSVTLEAGFADDPHVVSIAAGGNVDASSLGGGCVGMIGDPPDFDLYYTPGSLPLYISASSDSDISLVVNLPDGSWICDDDSAGNLNPGITLDSPQDGLYDIWIGNLSGSGNPDSTLYISELGYQADGSAATGGSGIDYAGTPYFGEVALESGFAEDPYSVYISAGGANDASTLGGSCTGSIGGPPDFNLDYTAGSLPLYISATSDDDLTLVVNTPDGSWACDDDSGAGPLDPGLTWSKPSSGVYNIWVGHYSGDGNPEATLHISEVGYHDTRVTGSGGGGGIDLSAPAVYGDVDLTAGFTPDPYTMSLTPGGDNDSREVSDACVGNIGGPPDVNLNYSSGSFPLYIFAESDSDVTLVVNTPDGTWVCDDDSSAGLNPGVSFKSPAGGLYNIWVGTFGGAEGEATLNISETSMPLD